MELQPTDKEALSYTYSGLDAALEQHRANIQTYLGIIKQEEERIAWIMAVKERKQELDDGNDSI